MPSAESSAADGTFGRSSACLNFGVRTRRAGTMQAGRRRERDPAGVPVTGALLELAAAGDALECYAGPRVLQRLRDEAGLAVEITDDGSRYVLRDGRTVQHLRQALWACANVVEEAVGVDVDGGSGERSLAAVVESAWGSCRATLLRALQPIMRALPEESAGGAAAAAGTYESIGVSLAQVLLTLPDAGDAVARCLVQRAAELDQDISHREPITGVVTAFGADAAEQRLSSLCVEQLRWLQATLRCLRNDAEVAVAETRVPVTTPEPSALIDCLLSVLSIASSQLQLSIIETLPEVAASAEDMDAEEARIGDALVPLWDDCLGEGNGHRRIPLAVLDAVATFRSAAAGRRAQRQLVERALALLPSMPPGAEAALSIRFLLGSMAEASATPNAVDASASPPGELGKGLQGIRIFLAVRDSLADSGAASADARLVFEAVLVTLQRSRRVATAVMNWYAAAQRCDMRAAPDPDDCSDVWRVIAGEPSLADVWFALAIFIAHPDLLQKRPGGMSWMRRGAAAVNARTVIGWLLLRGNVLQRFLVDASEWFDESFGAAILRLFHCCCQDAAALAGAERPQRVSQVAHTWQWLLLQLPRHRPECLLNALDAVSSGDAWQRAMALQTLCLVAEEEPRALHPFLPLMYGLLDYVEVLAPPQFGDIVTSSTDSAKRARPSSAAAVDEQPLRLLFRVLGALHAHAVCVAASRRHGQEVALPCSDGTLDNLLQKELRHHDVVYQRIGCVAAAALVERCAQSTATVHRALELLELALRCTEQRPQVAARLYDELSQVALVPMRGGAAANTASVASASRWQVSEFLFQQCVCHLSRLFLTTTTTTTTPPWSRAEEGARVRRQYGLSAGDTAFVVRIDALAVTGTATDREWLALLCPLCRLAFHALPSDEQRQQRFRDELLPLLRARWHDGCDDGSGGAVGGAVCAQLVPGVGALRRVVIATTRRGAVAAAAPTSGACVGDGASGTAVGVASPRRLGADGELSIACPGCGMCAVAAADGGCAMVIARAVPTVAGSARRGFRCHGNVVRAGAAGGGGRLAMPRRCGGGGCVAVSGAGALGGSGVCVAAIAATAERRGTFDGERIVGAIGAAAASAGRTGYRGRVRPRSGVLCAGVACMASHRQAHPGAGAGRIVRSGADRCRCAAVDGKLCRSSGWK
eukprot:ctg_126.g81